MSNTVPWWRTAVIYHILVPSFYDTDADGWGDINGITEKLDYIQWFGVDAIWLSPVYPSPLLDLGYDISDYLGVEPKFGTLDGLDRLVSEAHSRDLKVILDWVPNHSSDRHSWFCESRSSRNNPKRDWYIWRDGKPDGSPPNNWISVFGGSVWQWDDHTGQYYMHHFLDSQPDLNWRNPDMQAAMYDSMRFWLSRGVDGFRIDALDMLIKDEQFRDNPPNPDYEDGNGPDSQHLPVYTRAQKGIHDIVAQMRKVADEYPDRLLAGELYLPLEEVALFYGREKPELHLPLNLRLCWTSWDRDEWKSVVDEYNQKVGSKGWPTWSLSMHDCARLAARCPGEHTRLAAMLLLTLRGTPTHYYGEEIGMRGTPIPANEARDPQGRRTGRNRDPQRTPMQWNSKLHADFSRVEPWLPISDDFQTANVSDQSDDPHSLLTLYRRLLQLRRDTPALNLGEYQALELENPLLGYQRSSNGRRVDVVLNFGDDPVFYRNDDIKRILISTNLDRDHEVSNEVEIRGGEGLVVSH